MVRRDTRLMRYGKPGMVLCFAIVLAKKGVGL